MLRVDVGTQMDKTASVQGHVESESEDNSSLRLQLAAAHQALRLQTARFRQATKRLEQRDLEINSMTSLRDQHLNRVLRALVVLEAGLRREQRSIRSQLGERDVIIRAQQHEIAQLKKALYGEVRQEDERSSQPCQQQSEPKQFDYDCAVKPDLISSLGISHFQRCQVTPITTDNEDCQSNLDSLQLSFYEIGSQPESLLSNVSSQSCSGGTPDTPREKPSSMKSHCNYSFDESHNLPDVNLKYSDGENNCKCQEDNSKNTKFDDNAESIQSQKNELNQSDKASVLNRSCPTRSVHFDDRTISNFKDCKPSPSTLLQEVRISGRNEYEDNPVLNCVNQILLRDQEEFLEEQRVLRLKEEEKSKKETKTRLNNQKLSRSTDNLELLNDKMIGQHFPVKNIIIPSLENVISQQQKVHQTTRKKHISPHTYKKDNLKTIQQPKNPLNLPLLKENVHNKSIPPALPPKPQRLITNHKMCDQKTTMQSILPQLKCGDSLSSMRKCVSLHKPSDELYVISNSAIDDEVLLQLQGNEIDSYSEPNKSKFLMETKGNIYNPVLIHPTHKSPVKSPYFVPKTTKTPKEDNLCKTIQNNPPENTISSLTSYIKVASPVACLINNVEAMETPTDGNSEKQPSPSVSQIVRKFEDLGSKSMIISESPETYDNNNLQKNFEEFHLDECDMDDINEASRPEGDGAETRLHVSAMALEANISYENFLDATGLSQKSIATPSRLFSNHKRVMKPKDVKHRSRVKAVDRCSNTPTSTGSVVRYWTEPFL